MEARRLAERPVACDALVERAAPEKSGAGRIGRGGGGDEVVEVCEDGRGRRAQRFGRFDVIVSEGHLDDRFWRPLCEAQTPRRGDTDVWAWGGRGPRGATAGAGHWTSVVNGTPAGLTTDAIRALVESYTGEST